MIKCPANLRTPAQTLSHLTINLSPSYDAVPSSLPRTLLNPLNLASVASDVSLVHTMSLVHIKVKSWDSTSVSQNWRRRSLLDKGETFSRIEKSSCHICTTPWFMMTCHWESSQIFLINPVILHQKGSFPHAGISTRISVQQIEKENKLSPLSYSQK